MQQREDWGVRGDRRQWTLMPEVGAAQMEPNSRSCSCSWSHAADVAAAVGNSPVGTLQHLH